MPRKNNAPQSVTVNSRKYDGAIRRSWTAQLTDFNPPLIELSGVFEFPVDHPDLGHIAKGTVSNESYWLDRWYNIFDFRHPDGSERNQYINISMPPTFDGGTLDYVDLDIDLIVWPTAEVEVLDMEDFRSNAALYGYPDDLARKAEKTLNELVKIAECGALSRLYSEDVAAD